MYSKKSSPLSVLYAFKPSFFPCVLFLVTLSAFATPPLKGLPVANLSFFLVLPGFYFQSGKLDWLCSDLCFYFVSKAAKFKNYFFSNLQISKVFTTFLHIMDSLLIKYDMMIFFSGFFSGIFRIFIKSSDFFTE